MSIGVGFLNWVFKCYRRGEGTHEWGYYMHGVGTGVFVIHYNSTTNTQPLIPPLSKLPSIF